MSIAYGGTIKAGSVGHRLIFHTWKGDGYGVEKVFMDASEIYASYYREGEAAAVHFAVHDLATPDANYSSGGVIMVDDGSVMAGLVRIDVPNAAFAAGATFVVVQINANGGSNIIDEQVIYWLESATLSDLSTSATAIKAKTDNLPGDPADASDIAASFATVNGKLDTIDDYVDTEVAAIKAKTDLIPASPAAVGDIPTVAQIWARLVADMVTANSIGKLLADNVNATIASRATPAQILATPAQLLQTDAAGAARVADVDMTETAGRVWDAPRNLHNTPDTFGEGANALPRLILWDGDVISGDIDSLVLDVTIMALPDFDDAIKHQTLYIESGPGAGQERRITKQTPGIGSHEIFVDIPWVSIPNNTSKAVIFAIYNAPFADEDMNTISGKVWSMALGAEDNADTFGRGVNDMLRRMGAITGAGANTVLGLLRAAMRSDVAAPTDIGGTYSPATSSLQAIPARFGFGNGTRFVTVTVLDDSAAPIEGVILVVRNAAGTSLPIGHARTNADGQVVFSLNEGDYSIGVASSPVFEAHDPIPITVPAGPLAVPIELVVQPLEPPDLPDTCNVVCKVISSDGTPKEGVGFVFTILSTNISEVGASTVLSLDQKEAKTQADGIMQQAVIRPDAVDAPIGVTVQWTIVCGSLGITRTLDAELNHDTFDLGLFVHP